MGSTRAALAAKKVSESIRKGKPVKIGQVLREVGYSESVALSPTIVTETKSYKEIAVPLISGMQMQIEKFKKAIAAKDLSAEELKVLVYSLDTFTKNYQLLSGGATERQVFVVPSEIMQKNQLEGNEKNFKKLENGSS